MKEKSWTVGRKLLTAFAAAALSLLVVASLGYWSVDQLVQNNGRVDHSQKIRRDLAFELASLTEAEAQQRGYLISGDAAYLASNQTARADVLSTYADLKFLTKDNAGQEASLAQLGPLLDRRLALLAQVRDVRKASGLALASKDLAAFGGEKVMAEIRQTVAAMDASELALLQGRSSKAEYSARVTRTIILWGGLAGIVFISVLGFFIAESLSRQVGSSVGRIQSSSTELRAAANQQASASREQATSMSEISTTISELLVTSRQIAESARRVAQIAGEASQAAGQGGRTVERCQESITGIRTQVDLVVVHMLELGRKSQRIGGILEIINELAEQTNILSINAAVEAAGAGEAGRRFAVVADEIRKLADRVGLSTKEIRALVDEVRSAVNTTVMATEGGSKAVEAGARQFTEVSDSFRGIAGLVGTSTEAAREIELSTKQQATAVDQVTVAVASVAQASRETEAGAVQTLQTAGELMTLAAELALLIRDEGRTPVRA